MERLRSWVCESSFGFYRILESSSPAASQLSRLSDGQKIIGYLASETFWARWAAYARFQAHLSRYPFLARGFGGKALPPNGGWGQRPHEKKKGEGFPPFAPLRAGSGHRQMQALPPSLGMTRSETAGLKTLIHYNLHHVPSLSIFRGLLLWHGHSSRRADCFAALG